MALLPLRYFRSLRLLHSLRSQRVFAPLCSAHGLAP
jgi:hypothetical protein